MRKIRAFQHTFNPTVTNPARAQTELMEKIFRFPMLWIPTFHGLLRVDWVRNGWASHGPIQNWPFGFSMIRFYLFLERFSDTSNNFFLFNRSQVTRTWKANAGFGNILSMLPPTVCKIFVSRLLMQWFENRPWLDSILPKRLTESVTTLGTALHLETAQPPSVIGWSDPALRMQDIEFPKTPAVGIEDLSLACNAIFKVG